MGIVYCGLIVAEHHKFSSFVRSSVAHNNDKGAVCRVCVFDFGITYDSMIGKVINVRSVFLLVCMCVCVM